MELKPTVEPNRYWTVINDEVYIARAGSSIARPNRTYLGPEHGPVELDKVMPYNEIASRRFSSGENCVSVMHHYANRVYVWHYGDTGAGYWRCPSTADIRQWVDSKGYRRTAPVDIKRMNAGVLLPTYVYEVIESCGKNETTTQLRNGMLA